MAYSIDNGGITRSGSSGSYTYFAVAGFENKPVVNVSFWDALRFANWLNNGQGSGDTETGAYTITAAGIAANSIMRNPGAITFVPTENEWFKAAYYNAASATYNAYPFADGFDGVVCEAPPGTTSHSANCPGGPGKVTDVGAYKKSPSSYGTFDQGGDVFQWNETIIAGSARGNRGGSWEAGSPAASDPNTQDFPPVELPFVGFRVASVVPEPATGLLLLAGVLGLAMARRTKGVSALAARHPARVRSQDHP
jgi:formylglycine-generating enzyme required for sulfatase activity